MTLAMALGGILAEVAGPAPVIGVFGVLTMVAGLAGLLVPAVRERLTFGTLAARAPSPDPGRPRRDTTRMTEPNDKAREDASCA